MKTYILNDEVQVIGHAGEQGGVTVDVDVSAWLEEYPDGIGTIECTRPDGRIEPLEVTPPASGGTMMSAVLTPACLSRPGEYLYNACWTEAGTLRRSQTYRTVILATENGRGLPPDRPGTPKWASDIMVKAEQIDVALDAALQMAQFAVDAENAKDAAETAQDKAEDAQEAAEAAQAAAEAAADTVTTSTVEETLEYLGIN